MLTRIFFTLFVLFASEFNAFGYEVVSSKTEVSPGCEGGIASALSSLNLWVGLARKLPRLSDRKSPHIDQY